MVRFKTKNKMGSIMLIDIAVLKMCWCRALRQLALMFLATNAIAMAGTMSTFDSHCFYNKCVMRTSTSSGTPAVTTASLTSPLVRAGIDFPAKSNDPGANDWSAYLQCFLPIMFDENKHVGACIF